jgi:hypothetical protein
MATGTPKQNLSSSYPSIAGCAFILADQYEQLSLLTHESLLTQVNYNFGFVFAL